MLIPQNLQAILWSKNTEKLDSEKNKVYIINQILAFRTLNHLKWLFKTYQQKDITKVFLEHPLKIYQKSTFHFVKNILLNLKGEIPEEKYVSTLPRNIRQS
ncbi:hypothetical protein A2164_03485 [Candidatus Curtissbacteria bacterium RBG_13_35_7]|uniref:DUF6922 domain-containing protein n=1 Tax=Candidatus Curtissbacteria bacterium RBG_13_35_7 TaxID=1797705 RepID=A0A1F5G424_9BACT|nr:MAG: hypothetical protein A2164_03485 [Candidatus Curtissbacteria bacterium RBG_13_35_7]